MSEYNTLVYTEHGGATLTIASGGKLNIEAGAELEIDSGVTFDIDGALDIDNTLTVGESGTGYDVTFYGDTAGSYFLWDEDQNQLVLEEARMRFGTLSSDSQTGFTLTSSHNSVLDVFSDDGNATLTNAVYTTVRGRCMLFKDATGVSIFGVRGQIKAAHQVDFGPGVYAGVQGYMELVGDTSVQSGGKYWAVDASIDVPTLKTLTVASGGIAAAFHAELTGLGTATDNGTLAGLYIDEQISNGNWSYGVLVASTTTDAFKVDADATIGLNISTNCTPTDAIKIAGACTDGIDISGACSAYGINITGTCTTAGIFLDSTNKLMFDDSGMYIRASADGHLEIVSDDTITLSAPGHGGIVFGGETDWGDGLTGHLIDGTGWDWCTQTVAHVDSGALDTSCAAAYHALTVTPATHTTASSFFGTWTELYLQPTQNFANAANCAAVWGQVEAGASVTTTGVADCFTAGGYFNVKTGASFNNNAAHVVNGVRVQSEISSTTITNSGRLAAFECLTKSGSYQDWDYGLYIDGATYGVHIPAAATTTHAILIGDEGSEMPVADSKDYQLGVFAKVGTETSSKVLSSARFLMDSDETIARGSTYNALYATNYYEGTSKTVGGASVHDVVWAELWSAGGTAWTIGDNVWMHAIRANVEFPNVTVASASSHVFGVRVSSDVHDSATMGGDFSALRVDKQAGHKDWTKGLDVNNCATGLYMRPTAVGIDSLVSTVASGSYGHKFLGYSASAKSDGVAGYFEGHASGTSTGAIYGLGAWLNVDSGTHAHGLYGLDVGVWADDATYTSAYVCAASFYTHVCNDTAAPTNHYMLRFNTDQSEDTPDAWFHAANPECIACTDNADATGSKIAAIKIEVTGSSANPGYIWVYDSTGA